MKLKTKQAFYWSLTFLAVGLITPSLVIFCLEVFVGHIDPLASLTDILRRQFAEGDNLFWIALFGLIPFVVLSMVCFGVARRLEASRLACVAVGGLLGIISLMVWGHVVVWYPVYGGGHMSSTAAIAFIYIPFYCLGTLVIGLLVGWGLSFLPFFRHAHKQVA